MRKDKLNVKDIELKIHIVTLFISLAFNDAAPLANMLDHRSSSVIVH